MRSRSQQQAMPVMKDCKQRGSREIEGFHLEEVCHGTAASEGKQAGQNKADFR